MPAFQPYWGKPAVRNDRGDRGNVGIMRSPLRASILPDQSAREAAGATGTRRSPRPLWAGDSSTPRAHGAARSRTYIWILRHCERSEAIHLAAQGRMDCFVASLLAMTVWLFDN